MVISIVIDSDSDRGHCYEHFKKYISIYDENWTRDIYLNVYVYDEFWAARNVKKEKFGIFQAQPASGLLHPYFVCKSIFRVISMTKMVILDQSKPISLYLKIKKLKNPKFVNCTFIILKKIK